MDDTLRVIEFGRCRVERRQGAAFGHVAMAGLGTMKYHQLMGMKMGIKANR